MLINYHFDVIIGKQNKSSKLYKEVVQIDTGIKKPDQQYLFNAIDELNLKFSNIFPIGTPINVSNTKTEYIFELKQK